MHTAIRTLLAAFLLVSSQAVVINAELVQLVNGDQLHGRVVSMNESHVQFESEITGRMELPRDKVVAIFFQLTPRTVGGVRQDTASVEELIQRMQKEGIDPASVRQIQQQLLGGNPEASRVFNEMVQGLMSGELSVKDVRARAQDSIEQIRAHRDELEEEVGPLLDGYLSILEGFVERTAPPENKIAEEPDEKE